MTDWQPIETAPRDGTPILVIDTDGELMCAQYHMAADGRAYWCFAHDESQRFRVGRPLIHWMPLPEPPK